VTVALLRVSVDQRRARLARRHHLAGESTALDPEQVARSVVAVHATDPATVHLSMAVRLGLPPVATVEDALYERRTLIRMLGMRRTMFVVPVESAAVVQAAATNAIADRQRRLLLTHLERGSGHDEPWLAEVEKSTVEALARRGSATAAQLSTDEPRLRTQLLMAEGKKYEALANITTRVLTVLSAEGRIVRGRPRGSWISSQYAWWPIEAWIPGGLRLLDPAAARTELARQWLAAYGPATVADLTWWSGWNKGQVTAALGQLEVERADLDGVEGLVLADDVDEIPPAEPWVALLPALDTTVMGWQQRQWYLGEHSSALFDTNGNAGPTVWCDGRIVGGWAQCADGRIAWRLLEDIGSDNRQAVAVAAERLQEWIGPIRFIPRFRTPLERELSAAA
jgi:Winged helix DNA-binding domain